MFIFIVVSQSVVRKLVSFLRLQVVGVDLTGKFRWTWNHSWKASFIFFFSDCPLDRGMWDIVSPSLSFTPLQHPLGSIQPGYLPLSSRPWDEAELQKIGTVMDLVGHKTVACSLCFLLCPSFSLAYWKLHELMW